MNQFSPRKKVLLTGGCGKIGAYFARSTANAYDLRIVDRAPWDPARLGGAPGEDRVSDLRDLQACRDACAGMDVVIHLAADADPEADFLSSLLSNNILATYNLFRTAKEAGCGRFIFASSAHAVAAYPRDVQVKETMPVRPTNLYGVSKCFGEALAAHYAMNEGLPSIAIRIGAYLFPEEIAHLPPDQVDAYLHPDDFNHLLVRCIETPDVQFFIAHAISDNRYKRLDLTETRRVLGYHPQADGFSLVKSHDSFSEEEGT
jgi:nucleoside-diphosphate-sugar epimerase